MKIHNLKSVINKPIQLSVNKNEMSILLRQLSALLISGIMPNEAIFILKDQKEIRNLNYSLNKIYIDINNGEILSDAFSKYKIYDDFFIAMIKTGEESGTLGIVCEKLSNYYEKEDEINKKMKVALLYPVILLITTVIVMIFIFKNIMPVYISLFENSNMILPNLTKILIAISKFVNKNFILLIIIFSFIILLFLYFRKVYKFKITLDYIKIKIPIIGKNYIKILTSRFSKALAISYSSGVNFMDSLEIISSGINNLYFREKIINAKNEIIEGYSIFEAFNNTNVLPGIFNSMVEVGEETGKLGEILNITSDYYQKESDYGIKYILTVFEPIMIIVMAVFVGLVVISIALPMFELVNNYY